MVKSRTKLVKQLEVLGWVGLICRSGEECHARAWAVVKKFMENNMQMFVGQSLHADSMIMPSVRSWMTEALQDLGTSVADTAVVLWLNCPTASIMPASKTSFFVSLITNVLSDYKGTAIAIVVAPNRAGQADQKTGFP